MRVLQVHNQYYSGLGGEDTVVRLEEELLSGHGHEVRQLIVSTSELKDASALGMLHAAASSVWSRRGYRAVAGAVSAFRPDVVHVHNTFPLLSPSVYYAARQNGACVVQTLHNYRVACANGILLRNGVPCCDCVGRSKWRGLAHRCYDRSVGLSGSVVAIQTAHRLADTYSSQVDAYIALTSFQRGIVVRDGLSPARVHVKPNFVAERRPAEKRSGQNAQFTFVGSIRKEKGIDLLLQAWIKAQPKGYRLVLLGDGPDRAELQRQYASEESVVWMGFRSALEVARALKNSKYIAVCSRWYEGFPMVLLEAFRSGTPAIAPDHAAFPEIVERGKCGFLFEPSNLDSLTDALHTAASVSERVWREQSNSALRKAEEYSAAANYVRLMEIYGAAREHYSRKQ